MSRGAEPGRKDSVRLGSHVCSRKTRLSYDIVEEAPFWLVLELVSKVVKRHQ